jgi:branched-chain amino acid transport system permease protein
MADYLVSLVSFFSISLILAMSCFIVFKSGEISFGQQAFFGVGAYAGGILTSLLGWPIWTAIAMAGVCGAAAAFFAGIALVRATGFQFSLTTLVIGEFARELFQKIRWANEVDGRVVGPDGPLGFSGIDYFYLHNFTPAMQATVSFAIAAASVLLVLVYLRSREGKALLAVAADPELCASFGMSPSRVRLQAFVLAGGIAGVGGALFAHYATYIDATNFSLMLGVHSVAYTLIGGLSSVLGPALGTFVDIVFLELLRVTGAYRMLAFGALLVLVLILRPHGLLGRANSPRG